MPRPDGYNIILINSNHVVPPIGYKPNYDVIKSFAPNTNAANVPSLMIAQFEYARALGEGVYRLHQGASG